MSDLEDRLTTALRDRAAAVTASHGSADAVAVRAVGHDRRRRLAVALGAMSLVAVVLTGSVLIRRDGRTHGVTVPGPSSTTLPVDDTGTPDLTTGFVVLVPRDRHFSSPSWAATPISRSTTAGTTRLIELADSNDQRIVAIAEPATAGMFPLPETVEGLRSVPVGVDRSVSSVAWIESGWRVVVQTSNEKTAGGLASVGGPIEAVVSALTITADAVDIPTPPLGWTVLVDGLEQPSMPAIGQEAGITIGSDSGVHVTTTEVAPDQDLDDPARLDVKARQMVAIRGHEALAVESYNGNNGVFWQIRWFETPKTVATMLGSVDVSLDDLMKIADGLESVTVDDFRDLIATGGDPDRSASAGP